VVRNSVVLMTFDIQVAVNDFYAQKAFDVYRGFLQLFTIRRRSSRQQSCTQLDDLLLVPSSVLKNQVNNVVVRYVYERFFYNFVKKRFNVLFNFETYLGRPER